MITNRLTSCTTTRGGQEISALQSMARTRQGATAWHATYAIARKPVNGRTIFTHHLLHVRLGTERAFISVVQRGGRGLAPRVAFSLSCMGLAAASHVPAADRNTGRLLSEARLAGIAHFDWDSRISRDACTVNTHPKTWSSRSSMRLHTRQLLGDQHRGVKGPSFENICCRRRKSRARCTCPALSSPLCCRRGEQQR